MKRMTQEQRSTAILLETQDVIRQPGKDIMEDFAIIFGIIISIDVKFFIRPLSIQCFQCKI